MIKKKLLILGLSAMMTFAAAGCGKKEEETTAAVQDSKEYSINVTESSMLNSGNLDDVDLSKDGKVRSDLTGEWIDKDLARRKPVACTIENTSDAFPQSSVERADIYYEMLEEGGIDRLVCIFTDYDDLTKIGPMRSVRYYMVRKVVEHQAFLIHWGKADNAIPDLQGYPGVEHYEIGDGVDGCFRDPDRVGPHDAYITGEGINKCRAEMNYQLDKNENYKKMFHFNTEDTELADGQTAKKISTVLNEYSDGWFEYDEATKEYKRFMFGGPQIDAESGNQLHVKNVIVIFTYHGLYVCPDGEENVSGWIDIDLVGSGDGFYATDGKIIPIKWKKGDSAQDVTEYFTEDGKELQINPGKTWITYMQDDNKAGLKVE